MVFSGDFGIDVRPLIIEKVLRKFSMKLTGYQFQITLNTILLPGTKIVVVIVKLKY